MRRAPRPFCCSAPRRFSGSRFPTTPRSICRCAWRRLTAAPRATPGWSMPYCAAWRRAAPPCWPNRRRAIRRTGCSRVGPKPTAPSPRHRASQRRAGAHLTVKQMRSAGPSICAARAADRHGAHHRAWRDIAAAGLRRRLVGAGRRRRVAGPPARRRADFASPICARRRRQTAQLACAGARHRGRPFGQPAGACARISRGCRSGRDRHRRRAGMAT